MPVKPRKPAIKPPQGYDSHRVIASKGQRWHATDSAKKRRQILHGVVDNEGYAPAIRRLYILRRKAKNPRIKSAIQADIHYLHEKYR